MISILIPVYNYDVSALVEELSKQCLECKVAFEILISDDCSTQLELRNQNQRLHNASSVFYYQQSDNLGNAANRNFLAQKAKYEWLLFLDADTFPFSDQFVQIYLDHINRHSIDVLSGGIVYDDTPPKGCVLKWKHGKAHEEISLDVNEDDVLQFRGNNFMILRSVFLSHVFLPMRAKYGYVDTVFGVRLFLAGKKLKIVYNPVYHLGLESNEIFVKKYENSVKNALFLLNTDAEVTPYIRLLQQYKKVRVFKPVLRLFYILFSPIILWHLHSSKATVLMFQVYKLFYLAHLDVAQGRQKKSPSAEEDSTL